MDLAPAERERVLDAEAEGDVVLVATVRAMLAADEGTNDLIDQGIEPRAHIAIETDARDAAPLRKGDSVGDFDIVSEIGRGGMGVVYAARDRTLGRVAALKLLPAAEGGDPSAGERLVAEAQAASALDHPNVATIYQIGMTEDGRRFIAMARYEGETLRDRLARGAVPPRDAFDIARQVAAGLAAAHQAGLVHRDVKPENIFITRDGLVKLLDFGIATLAGSAREGATTRGTVRYMSPEQTRREAPDSRSDVWSLGVVLYEMIVGSTPFTGATTSEILALIADPHPVRVPASIRCSALRSPSPSSCAHSRRIRRSGMRTGARCSATSSAPRDAGRARAISRSPRLRSLPSVPRHSAHGQAELAHTRRCRSWRCCRSPGIRPTLSRPAFSAH